MGFFYRVSDVIYILDIHTDFRYSRCTNPDVLLLRSVW